MVSVTVSGSDYLKEQGVEELLTGILKELDTKRPANLLQHIQEGLESAAKKRKLDSMAPGELPAFPAPGELEWRRVAKARSLECEGGPSPGAAEVLCKGEDRKFPVHPKDTALVLIDMQTDFLEPTGRVGQHYKESPIQSGMDGCERLLKACRAAGFTIAHSRSHRYGSAVHDQLVGTDDVGYELHPRLRAIEGEIVVDKWTYGAFASTFLEAELRKRGVNRILLCGVLTNVCIFATASQAVDRFFRVCLVSDACAAFDQKWHDFAIGLINEPQTKKGHNGQVGLYFGEIAKVQDVEDALKAMKKE